MRASSFRFVLWVLLATGMVIPAQSQDVQPADSVRVVTEIQVRDGSTYLGTIIEESADIIRLSTLGGTVIEIRKSQIESRREIAGRVREGRFLPFDPNRTRLFFAPTARALKKGQGYIADYWLFLGFVGAGVTDRFTMAGGILLFPESWGDFFYLAPKFTVLGDDRQSFAVGVLTGFITEDWGDDGIGTFGIMYGVYTLGRPDGAVTLGAGYAFAEGDIANSPTITIGLEKGLSRRTKFISENWLFPGESAAIWSAGMRFYGSRLAADLALVGTTEDTGVLPWLGFAYNFGH